MTGDQARAAAEHRFGNALLLRERALDAHIPRRLDQLARDVGFAGRLLRRSPRFTARSDAASWLGTTPLADGLVSCGRGR
jgi:hypothetical protein